MYRKQKKSYSKIFGCSRLTIASVFISRSKKPVCEEECPGQLNLLLKNDIFAG